MRFLHSVNILHRDLKPGNILVDESDTIKIMDYGVSCALPGTNERDSRREYVGTEVYMAPEVREDQRYSEKSDVSNEPLSFCQSCGIGVRSKSVILAGLEFRACCMANTHLSATLRTS